MTVEEYNAIIKTIDYFVERFEGKPDRKGALQDLRNERTRFELEAERYGRV